MRPLSSRWIVWFRLLLLGRVVRSWSPNNHFRQPLSQQRTSLKYPLKDAYVAARRCHPTSTTRLHIDFPLSFFSREDDNKEKLSEGRASVTNRLPIGKIFDSRDYIFSTTSNVRGYEWTLKETEELLDDLIDASKGVFTSVDDTTEVTPAAPQDYELSQIVLIPMEWDKEALGLGARYDVYDGQQRLVTMCLMFAAMRERAKQLGNSEIDNETVVELAGFLKPRKTRRQEVVRIELNRRDNQLLADLLNGDIDQFRETLLGSNELSQANQRIVENFQCFLERFEGFSKGELLALLDFVLEKVYLLVCIPESATIARNIVVGQGKGKDNEPIDDFKGLVCFRYTQDDKKMYQTFDEWDILSSSVVDIKGGSVGRKTVSDACILRASAHWRTKIGTNKQLFWWEQWLRKDVSTNNHQGSDFFQAQVQPASLALGRFREGSTALGDKSSEGFQTSLDFLLELTKGVAASKDIEMIVLELLLRADDSNSKQLSASDLEEYLHRVEELAIYFAVMRPGVKLKYGKLFAFLDALDEGDYLSSVLSKRLLSTEERSDMYKALAETDLGATASGRRLVVALLKRLNRHATKDTTNDDASADAAGYHLEPILPIKATKKAWGAVWPEQKDRDKWVHKIGNLCLVSKKLPAKDVKASFEEKKERYGRETSLLPLTVQLSMRGQEWDEFAVQGNSAMLVELVESIWGVA